MGHMGYRLWRDLLCSSVMDEGLEGEYLRKITVENDHIQPDNDNDTTTTHGFLNALWWTCSTLTQSSFIRTCG